MGRYPKKRILDVKKRILSRVRLEDRGWHTPCLIWLGEKDKDGYGRIKRDRHYIPVHWGLTNDPPEGMEKDHLCHQRDCVRPTHLEDVTKSVNTLRRRGTGNTTARMTPEIRAKIESMLIEGVSARIIAEETGFSRRTIMRVKNDEV
jgi:uncharacterized protein YerC